MKKILIVGQAPPKKTVEIPFGRSHLYKWLESRNIKYQKTIETEPEHNQEGIFLIDDNPVAEVKFAALINYFPGTNNAGGHLTPSRAEIETEQYILKQILENFNPNIVIPVGKLSIQECFIKEDIKLEEYIGKTFVIDPYNSFGKKVIVLPLPHPSGASTWYFNETNKKLLNKALVTLSELLSGNK